MRKYIVVATILGATLIILSAANLLEILHSKARANEIFRSINEQYDALTILKNDGCAGFASQDRIDHLEYLNREVEIHTVFISADNNRLEVRSLLLVFGIITLCALTLTIYFLSKGQIRT